MTNDPLHRARADAKLLSDLVQTWAPRGSQGVTDAPFQLGVNERATGLNSANTPGLPRSSGPVGMLV
jgi:hypothetical protein